MDKNIKSKTGTSTTKKVGHTTGDKFGQSVSAKEKGAPAGTGADLNLK